MIRSSILGCGAYLPARIFTNDELIKAHNIESDSAWIERRTGITQRHIAREDEKTSDMATAAARAALADAKLTASDIDLIVLATTTPDHSFPAAAVKVQANLGMERGAAFDVQAVCSGFVYALILDPLRLDRPHDKRALRRRRRRRCDRRKRGKRYNGRSRHSFDASSF